MYWTGKRACDLQEFRQHKNIRERDAGAAVRHDKAVRRRAEDSVHEGRHSCAATRDKQLPPEQNHGHDLC